jgi:hypothetical protein
MKVALLTNMNNNYFTLLRYLVDMGVDAKVFMTEDEHPHFLPENDSWNVEKWLPYIDTIPVKYYDINYIRTFDKALLRSKLEGFDIIMGSGPAPAYLEAAGMKLDVFFPYKTGIEYFDTPKAKINRQLRRDTIYMEELQKEGLRKVKHCVNWDLRPITIDRIRGLGMQNHFTCVPVVYNDAVNENQVPPSVAEVTEKLKTFNFVICSASRHLWVKPWWDRIKQFGYDFINNNANQYMIHALDNLVKKHGAKDACLLFYEYGPHVQHSKDLIEKLGLTPYVIWMPLSARKVILYLHQFVHLGIGDIAVGAWGGKSIEYLSKGVPCINSIAPEVEAFESHTGIPLPPFIKIRKPEELTGIFEKYYLDRGALQQVSTESKDWFDKYEGKRLAEKTLNLMTQINNKIAK